MKILALDLGKYKTVGCDYERESGKHRFLRVASLHGSVAAVSDRSKTSGWSSMFCNVADGFVISCEAWAVEVQVANTSDDALGAGAR
jgi:hypothetical protein